MNIKDFVKENNIKIILASASPRRKELIKHIFDDVKIRPADCDETLPEGIPVSKAAEYLSRIKNAAARTEATDELVISADTVVASGDEILGKPKDERDAERMIRLLSGKTHSVFTGVTIYFNGKEKTFAEETKVSFNTLTDEEINEYISDESREWSDKAGGYGIQGIFAKYISSITGDYYNVVGLPVSKLYKELKDFI